MFRKRNSIKPGTASELLIISLSGRIFAQSAYRGGWKPITIDQFADQDTREYSEKVFKVNFAELKDNRHLIRSINRQAQNGEPIGLIYGSGVDHRIDFLDSCFDGFLIYGNSMPALRMCYDPKTFFPLLDRLAIPFPEICFNRPVPNQNWLLKNHCSEGGCGVEFFQGQEGVGKSTYFQKFVEGRVLSALFLADGVRANVVGFNTQWTSQSQSGYPFMFSGAINRADLAPVMRATIQSYIHRLVTEIGLKGLNSLDFILDKDICKIIELNPRPSASLALYDQDYSRGLLAMHISACQGSLVKARPKKTPVRAMKIVYSPRQFTIPQSTEWPEWSADRPNAGTPILPGQPLCSVLAAGQCEKSVEIEIKARENQIPSIFSSERRIKTNEK